MWEHRPSGYLGYGPGSLGATAAWWYERLHPDERERVVGSIHAVVARGENLWTDEHRFRRADGGWAHVEVRGSIGRDAAGDAVRMVGAALDVSARRRAELVSRCQGSLLRDIGSGLELEEVLRRVVAFTEACTGSIAAVHLLGGEGGLLRLMAGPNLPAALAAAIEGIDIGKEPGPRVMQEFPSARISPLLAADETVLGTIALLDREPRAPGLDDARIVQMAGDLIRLAVEREQAQAALRRSEDERRQSQRMEAVGQLAGGIAHDFNNLLTGILSYSDLVLQELEQGDPVRADVEQIRHAGHRAAALTRQLLAFSRRQVLQPKVLSLNSSVSDLDEMLRRLLGADVDLDIALDPGLWYVMADPGQLEQVLVNLTVHARDAMPDGGRLTIATANCRVGTEGPVRAGGVRPGAYATLSVDRYRCRHGCRHSSPDLSAFFRDEG